MPYSEKAAAITPPYSGKNTIVLASATSSARLKFPASWRRSIVTIQADGVDVYVCFGDTTVTAVIAGATTLTSEAPSAHGTGECIKIPNGQEKHFDLALIDAKNPGNANDQHAIRLAHIESATGGYVRIYRSSGPVNSESTGLV